MSTHTAPATCSNFTGIHFSGDFWASLSSRKVLRKSLCLVLRHQLTGPSRKQPNPKGTKGRREAGPLFPACPSVTGMSCLPLWGRGEVRMSWVAQKWKHYGTKCFTQWRCICSNGKQHGQEGETKKRVPAPAGIVHGHPQSKRTLFQQAVSWVPLAFPGCLLPIIVLVELTYPDRTGSFRGQSVLVRKCPGIHVFVSWGCHNNVPRTGWLRTAGMYCLTALETWSPKLRCLHTPPP